MRNIEVCLSTDSLEVLTKNVRTALEHGASRLELCSSMFSDGLTPSHEAAAIACEMSAGKMEVLTMIRPHARDFNYSKKDVDLILRSIEKFSILGADGIVFGAIDKTAKCIDLDVTNDIVDLCFSLGLKATFHRAFDVLADRNIGLEQLISVGVSRVLTSGTAWHSGFSADRGIEEIKRTIRLAANRTEIVIGGGVSEKNAGLLYGLQQEVKSVVSLHAFSSVHSGLLLDAKKLEALVYER